MLYVITSAEQYVIIILSVKENMPNNSALLNISSFSLPAIMDNYISLINDQIPNV